MQSMPIFQKLVVQPFPAKQAFLLARLTKKLDEEMTNLIAAQHAYAANAKVVSTVDELLDVVVNGLKK